MREIKFNCWDSLWKKYIRFDEWLKKEDIEVDSEYVTHNEALAKFLDFHYGCDLLQYTGLLDKQGVEIYEFMEIDNLFEVSFCDGCYILTNISNKDIIHLNFYLKEKNGQVEVTKEYTKI